VLSARWVTATLASYERYPDAARRKLQPAYRRREPDKTVLHQLVQKHFESCLERARDRSDHGFGYPAFVEREFKAFLKCGLLRHGFIRVRCADCPRERLVAFSCKRRGFCPSCTARRMANTAAHLVDNVLPEVHYRQWVLSFPKRVRFALACDHELLSKVLRACLNKLFSWQKRAARKQGIPAPECGAVTFCQRFGSLLNLNCHFHSLLPDGVFTDTGDGVAFLSIPPPSPDDIRRLTEQIAKATETILARHHQAGHSDDQPTDILDQERDQATHTNRFATKAAAPTKPHKRAHFYFGYSLHAERTVESDDRDALERLCRYGARAPIANSRLSINVDGDAVLELKRPLADGRTRLTFAPIELLRKLATLIPPPKKNLTRYHGVFAPAHHLRKLIVAGTTSQQSSQKTTRRLPWAALLRRVFAIDILKCDHCAGTMNIIAIIPASQIADQILDHLGLEMRSNPTRPRGPP